MRHLLTWCVARQSCLQADTGSAILSEAEDWRAQLQRLFVFAFTWSLGGSIPSSKRSAFDAFARQAFSGLDALQLPADGLLHDYDVQLVDGCAAFVPWTAALPAADVVVKPSAELADMLAPSAQSVCLQRLTQVCIGGLHHGCQVYHA